MNKDGIIKILKIATIVIGVVFAIGVVIDLANGNLFKKAEWNNYYAPDIYKLISDIDRVVIGLLGLLLGISVVLKKDTWKSVKFILIIILIAFTSFISIYQYKSIAVKKMWDPLVDVVEQSNGVDGKTIIVDDGSKAIVNFDNALGESVFEIVGLSSIISIIVTLICVKLIAYKA